VSVSLTRARIRVTCCAFGGSVYAGTIQPRSARELPRDVELVVAARLSQPERDERKLLLVHADQLEVAAPARCSASTRAFCCIISITYL
jgi:uncharacterized membrane protein YcgQ (UPF0703/DUF1980 family)